MCTYSIDDFNAKFKVAILQERQDWESPQIKDLRLVMPEQYTFMASNILFIAHGILDKYLEKTTQIKSTLLPGSYKASLDTSPPPRLLSLHCQQIKNVKNELDGQPTSLTARMHVSNNEATFSPMHLVFLELHTYLLPLDFKLKRENNNKVIPRTFYLQLLSTS